MKKIFEFTVLWAGWECDSKGWIAEKDDGTRCLLLTDHGEEYEADPKTLKKRVAFYQKTIKDSNKALAMLTK